MKTILSLVIVAALAAQASAQGLTAQNLYLTDNSTGKVYTLRAEANPNNMFYLWAGDGGIMSITPMRIIIVNAVQIAVLPAEVRIGAAAAGGPCQPVAANITMPFNVTYTSWGVNGIPPKKITVSSTAP